MGLPPALRHEHPAAIAHRGSMLLWPENTMHAFQQAVDLGYRYLETDIRISSDGVLMVHHDATLDRTTSGTGKVKDRTRDELARLDAAHHFSQESEHPLRDQGITIPTLDELLLTFPEAVVAIDIKEAGLEEPLADAIARLDAWERVIVGSFSSGRLRRFRKLVSRPVATAAGTAELARFLANTRLGRPSEPIADSLQVPIRYRGINVVDRAFVAAAHAAFKQVIVWTVNDGNEMRALLDMGVDGIITDRPDILRYVMEERGEGGPWHEGGRHE